MKACRGGRPAGGRRATRCGSPCRAGAAGVPGERSARTSSAAWPMRSTRRSPRRRSPPSSAGALTTSGWPSRSQSSLRTWPMRWPSHGTPSTVPPAMTLQAGRWPPPRRRSSRSRR